MNKVSFWFTRLFEFKDIMIHRQKNKNSHKELLELISEKFNRGSYKRWKNKDFEDLSFTIHRETKVLISSATLKRIFGKVKTTENYSPQDNTLKALQDYVGFENRKSERTKKRKWHLPIAITLLILSLGIIIRILIPTRQAMPDETLPKGSLSLEKMEGNGPTTAFFKYSAHKTTDTIFLDYGDGSQWMPVSGTNRTQSHFYDHPGYFKAVLRTKQRWISDPVKVLVPTQNWKALAHYFEKSQLDRYYPVPLSDNVTNGIFHASRKNLSSLGIDSTRIVVLRLDNYQNTEASGDSFILQTRIKNSSFWPAVRCFSVYIKVKGTKGKVLFKFVGIGCSHHGEYAIGETHKWGSSSDLSPFAIDLHQWSEITIQNEDQHVSVMLGDSVIFSEPYHNSIGKILGSTILFHGSGSVDYIHLKDMNGNAILSEDFD